MAAPLQKEMNDNMTVLATTTLVVFEAPISVFTARSPVRPSTADAFQLRLRG
jgi:hypothetical protein